MKKLFIKKLAVIGVIILSVFFATGCQQKAGNYTGNTSVDVCINETCDYIADGQSDQREIASAINSVISAGGGTVNIRSGNYNISSEIIVALAGKNVLIQGNGAKTVLTNTMATTTSRAYTFYVSDTATSTLSSITFKDLSFVGSATAGRAIDISTVHKAKMEDCLFSTFSGGYGVYTGSTTLLSLIDNYFTGNYSNVNIGNSYTEATILTPGKYTEWNGTNFTTMTYANTSSTQTIATTTLFLN